jgi:3-oxoacyl-[acyl-carrier-protein] synthase-3
MNASAIALLGTGYAVPPTVRTNDDPIFDWLRHHHVDHEDLFKGYKERRVLAPGEDLADILTDAAKAALDHSGVDIRQIGAIVGYASVSEDTTPNALYQTHHGLGIDTSGFCVPIQDEFTNFISGLVWAQQAIATGLISHAIVGTACNWTRHVSYHDEVSISIGDGAGAAVVGPATDPKQFRIVGTQTLTRSDLFGTMGVKPRPIPPDLSRPFTDGRGPEAFTRSLFFMSSSSDNVFKQWGVNQPPALVKCLLETYSVPSDQYTLIAHQASTVLINAWKQILGLPDNHYLNTIERFGNMTLASIPVTLSYFYDQIETDYLVLLGLGLGIHTTAILLQRG